ncbi:MAG TPA: universal stress protein [Methanoregula sp.]|nr:universal stress protein [Methanoregula sp.]
MPDQDPRDTGDCPPACFRCHPAHFENVRIQREEEKNFPEYLGFVVKVTVDVITSGNISTAILRKTECENVSSIIIGSRGRGRLKGLLLGSVSADILRHEKTHLLIFRHLVAGELREQYSAGSVPGYSPGYYSTQIFFRTCPKSAVINK